MTIANRSHVMFGASEWLRSTIFELYAIIVRKLFAPNSKHPWCAYVDIMKMGN